MIRVTGADGALVYLAPGAIASVAPAAARCRAADGTQAVIRLFRGEALPVRETVEEILRRMASIACPESPWETAEDHRRRLLERESPIGAADHPTLQAVIALLVEEVDGRAAIRPVDALRRLIRERDVLRRGHPPGALAQDEGGRERTLSPHPEQASVASASKDGRAERLS